MGNNSGGTEGFYESSSDDEDCDIENVYLYNDGDQSSLEELYDIIQPSDKLLLIQYYARKYYKDHHDINNFVPSHIITLISLFFPRLSNILEAIKKIPKENRVTKVKELFNYKKKIGEGSSGKVLLVKQKFGDKRECALKEIRRKHKVNADLFLREITILQSIKHENIMEIYGVYLDKSSYFIASPYYSGGEMFDIMIKKKTFSEKEAIKYIVPILSVINYLHNKGIAYRNLKPSNIVFDKKGKNGKLKFIDFGEATVVIDDHLYSGGIRLGAIIYAPPEWKIDRIGCHIKKGDLWCVGIIVYSLIVGRLPFGEWKHVEAYNNDLWFPKKLKQTLSAQCIDFIFKLLERDPDKRLSAKQALEHEWIHLFAK